MKRYLTFFLSILLLMECVPFKAQAQTGIRNHRKWKTAAQPINEAPVYEITLNSRDWSIERIRLYSRDLDIERKLGPYVNIVRKYQDKDPTFYRLVVTAGQKKYTAPFRTFKEFIVEDFSGESPRLIQIENVVDEKPTVSVPTDSILQGEILVSIIDNKGREVTRQTFRVMRDRLVNIHNNKEIALAIDGAHKILRETCGDLKEVIPHWNHLGENRINIIFAGHGYESVQQFASHLPQFVDPLGTGYMAEVTTYVDPVTHQITTETVPIHGMLGEEPFRSNKELFNFWYLNKVVPFPPGTPEEAGLDEKCSEFASTFAYSPGYCQISNKYVVHLVERTCGGINSWGHEDAYVSFLPPSQKAKAGSIRTMLHEIGHWFLLKDEYFFEGGGNYAGFPNCLEDKEDAIAAGWNNTFDGCAVTIDNVRSSENSIMRNASPPWDLNYNYINERHICYVLYQKTGQLTPACLEMFFN